MKCVFLLSIALFTIDTFIVFIEIKYDSNDHQLHPSPKGLEYSHQEHNWSMYHKESEAEERPAKDTVG